MCGRAEVYTSCLVQPSVDHISVKVTCLKSSRKGTYISFDGGLTVTHDNHLYIKPRAPWCTPHNPAWSFLRTLVTSSSARHLKDAWFKPFQNWWPSSTKSSRLPFNLNSAKSFLRQHSSYLLLLVWATTPSNRTCYWLWKQAFYISEHPWPS